MGADAPASMTRLGIGCPLFDDERASPKSTHRHEFSVFAFFAPVRHTSLAALTKSCRRAMRESDKCRR
jgi:hypothetical protein